MREVQGSHKGEMGGQMFLLATRVRQSCLACSRTSNTLALHQTKSRSEHPLLLRCPSPLPPVIPGQH